MYHQARADLMLGRPFRIPLKSLRCIAVLTQHIGAE